jgi:hypothetical protein
MCMPKWELIHVSILLELDNEKAKTPTASNAGDTRACQEKTRHHKDRHAVIEDTLQHGSQASRTPLVLPPEQELNTPASAWCCVRKLSIQEARMQGHNVHLLSGANPHLCAIFLVHITP